MPLAPPMKSAAASTLVTKKPIATGTPSTIRPSAVPKSSVATQYQAMLGPSGQRAAARKFSRLHRKRANSIAIIRNDTGIQPTTTQRGMSSERTSFSFCT